MAMQKLIAGRYFDQNTMGEWVLRVGAKGWIGFN